jgi:multiple sugar transport system ATP-binding protein
VADIIMEDLGKIYPDGTRAVGDIDLTIGDGEFLVLVGPSGCGKSTILRMIAGLEEITEGQISIGGRIINNVPPKDRDIAMVFQNYALYPHMSVFDNMAFGLKLRKMNKKEIRKRVAEAAETLEITEYLDRKPKALSGGQRQRVAMGRAIVREPAAFLMDEPLSNLDAKLRVQMRASLARLHASLGTTTVYVTHDQVEAMTLGQRVAVLKAVTAKRPDNLQQVAGPSELFSNPANLFVAGFIGTPPMNMILASMTSSGDGVQFRFGPYTLDVGQATLDKHPGLENYIDKEIVVGMRPGDFEDERVAGKAPGRTMAVDIDVIEVLGSETLVHYSLPVPPVITPEIEELLADTEMRPESLGTVSDFVSRISSDVKVEPGTRARLVVDTNKLYCFDRDTGERIGYRPREGSGAEAEA